MLTFSIISYSCGQPNGKLKLSEDKPDYTSQTLSSKQRKAITNRFLALHKIDTLSSLPEIEDYNQAHIRKDIIVARRCVILYGLINVSHQQKSAKYMTDYFKKYKLWGDVSPEEKKFLLNKPTKQANINMSWRIESLNTLLWALGHFQILKLPNVQCDFSEYENLPDLNSDPLNWIENAKLRKTEEILNEADLIYRIHWATTEARLKDKPMPYKFDNGVVYERHYAFNWLTMYADDWDEITTDT